MIGKVMAKLASMFGKGNCPKCASRNVEVCEIKRSPGQKDGFQGLAYLCRNCGYRWGKSNVPVL